MKTDFLKNRNMGGINRPPQILQKMHLRVLEILQDEYPEMHLGIAIWLNRFHEEWSNTDRIHAYISYYQSYQSAVTELANKLWPTITEDERNLLHKTNAFTGNFTFFFRPPSINEFLTN